MSKYFLATALLAGTALATPALAVPQYDHIVIVTMENHSLSQVIANPAAPATFLNNVLIPEGMLLTNSHGDDHSSEPNYNFQISGQPQGVGSTFAFGAGTGQTPNVPGVTDFPHLQQGSSKTVFTTNTSPVLNLTANVCATPATCVAVINNGTIVPISGNDSTIPGTNGDQIPLNTPNIGAQLIRAGLSFAGYTEGLPFPGDRTDINLNIGGTNPTPLPPSAVDTQATNLQRKHQTWITWQALNDTDPLVATPGGPVTSNELPSSVNRTFNQFPGQPGNPFADPNHPDFSSLPTVAFVTPDAIDDEHDQAADNGTNFNLAADNWLRKNIGAYAQWAITHNSLLIVTWDEDSGQFYTSNGIKTPSTFDPRHDVPTLNDGKTPLPVDANGNPLEIFEANLIPGVVVGAGIKQGTTDNEFVDHCSVLRTIEASTGISTLTNDPGQTCDVNAKPLTQAFMCDVDSNGQVDRNDIAAIMKSLNIKVALGDPRDFDQDGTVTIADARACTNVCTKAGCAP